jgi:hypothetical protein
MTIRTWLRERFDTVLLPSDIQCEFINTDGRDSHIVNAAVRLIFWRECRRYGVIFHRDTGVPPQLECWMMTDEWRIDAAVDMPNGLPYGARRGTNFSFQPYGTFYNLRRFRRILNEWFEDLRPNKWAKRRRRSIRFWLQ